VYDDNCVAVLSAADRCSQLRDVTDLTTATHCGGNGGGGGGGGGGSPALDRARGDQQQQSSTERRGGAAAARRGCPAASATNDATLATGGVSSISSNKTARGHKNSAANRRERKATKTLAIVLGTYCRNQPGPDVAGGRRGRRGAQLNERWA